MNPITALSNTLSYEKMEHYIMFGVGTILSYVQPTLTTYIDSNFDINEVCEGLYIGDFSSACNVDELKKIGITHIVTVIAGVKKIRPDLFEYHTIDICDRPYSSINTYFDESVDFIANGIMCGGKVLVHCQKGISRSSTIVAAYLIKKKDMQVDDAISLIKNARQCINPNDGFLKQLREYYDNIHGNSNNSDDGNDNRDTASININHESDCVFTVVQTPPQNPQSVQTDTHLVPMQLTDNTHAHFA